MTIKFKTILLLITVLFIQIQALAKSNLKQDYKIPKAVIRFAEKYQCTDLVKNASFNRPWYGYKGYDVYNGQFENGDLCIILYKFGYTRFPNYNNEEYLEVTLMKSPPLPPGLWWQWLREYRKPKYHMPLRDLLHG